MKRSNSKSSAVLPLLLVIALCHQHNNYYYHQGTGGSGSSGLAKIITGTAVVDAYTTLVSTRQRSAWTRHRLNHPTYAATWSSEKRRHRITKTTTQLVPPRHAGWWRSRKRTLPCSPAATVRLAAKTLQDLDEETIDASTTTRSSGENKQQQKQRPKVVLVAGFESFNRELYQQAAKELDLELEVFADSDIRDTSAPAAGGGGGATVNPTFERAVTTADAFVGSLIFDYDDAVVVQSLLPLVQGPRLIFECATELMTFNQVGTFNMQPPQTTTTMGNDDAPPQPPGPPPAVKAVLSKFSSGKEEDKLQGYLKLLKVGPDLLKFVPGEKAGDLRAWLTAYRYWNQGGASNVKAMLQIIADECNSQHRQHSKKQKALPELVVTPDIGVIHPLTRHLEGNNKYFTSPAAFLKWRLSEQAVQAAAAADFKLAPRESPIVAVLLFRKHVITEQRYLWDLITQMEKDHIIPVPIFINGVEAHTIVRDLLTSDYEEKQVQKGIIHRDTTYQAVNAVKVDAIVNTVGFPLVGGPAGSVEAGRNVAVAEQLLTDMNVPYIVAAPMLLQGIDQWKQTGVLGLQSVVLYALPELDGAIDAVVLGGLVGDKIALVPERVRKLNSRVMGWMNLKRTPPSERKIAVSLYGFPPNVGAVGTAALLNVPQSLENLLRQLHRSGYNVGDWANDEHASGQSLVAALAVISENPVIAGGASNMQAALDAKIARAVANDQTVAATLALPGAGLAGAKVRAVDVTADELEKVMGKYMFQKVRRAWSERDRGPGVSASGTYVVAGLEIGNVFVFVQPLLGLEGDPMRLLFERDLTPHPQYCATYEWLQLNPSQGGMGAQAIVHLGMHGTVEWLPGQPLGNDRGSWSDELLGDLPNLYAYAANNPSESILAKRRGYGTLVSYNVPPYGRAGLYLELANLKELVDDYRQRPPNSEQDQDLCQAMYDLATRSGMLNDVPLYENPADTSTAITNVDVLPDSLLDGPAFSDWVIRLTDYLAVIQERLFSSGLHVLGGAPTDEELDSYLEAYFGDKLSQEQRSQVIAKWHETREDDALAENDSGSIFSDMMSFFKEAFFSTDDLLADDVPSQEDKDTAAIVNEATSIVSLLSRSTEEMDNLLTGLDGGYIPPKPGGDLLRDGPAVLPTGRNIHALDPYRMPSATATVRGRRAAAEIIRQHVAQNDGVFPETVAVTLWGLDAIKTRGESIAIVLDLVGARPVKEGTGRIVRYELIPLEELERPRIDVLASMSGIFRDSFANVVDLLDDMFERAAFADEPVDMNYIKKHADELISSGVDERVAARLFSNPPGDYGSMVNEVVGSGDWEDSESLGETWAGRNVYSYGRNEGSVTGTARPAVLEKLLSTTERVVQEVDSVEYGLSDIQEYYANTGALKKAAENRKEVDQKTGKKKKVVISVIEAFGGGGSDDDTAPIPVKDAEDVLRMEYRSKLLNPKWRDTMLRQGAGGAYEISQRMTAMIGWSATADVDNFVFDQAAERYALDEEVAKQLQSSNPEAFKNVVRRLLEAAGRGMWSTDDATLDRLRELYSDADDIIEQGSSQKMPTALR